MELHADSNVRAVFDHPSAEVNKLHAIVGHCVGKSADHIRDHIRATRELAIEPYQFGDQCEEAQAAKQETLRALETLLRMQEDVERNDARCHRTLEEFREAVKLTDEDVTIPNGEYIKEAYQRLVEGELPASKYGKYLPEAKRIRAAAIVRYRKALEKLAWDVIDPDAIPSNSETPAGLLEVGLLALKALPITDDIFGERMEEAKQRHAQCIDRMERLVESAKAREIAAQAGATEEQQDAVAAQVHSGRKTQAERERAHREAEHGLTEQQRAARARRITEAAPELYEFVLRVTEIAHVDEVNNTGVLNAGEMLALLHRAEAIEARIEGRLN